MRLVSCTHDGRRFAATVAGDRVHPLAGIAELGPDTLLDALAATPSSDAIPLDEVTLRPVVPQPRKVICVGLNYRPHVTETGRDLPTYPVLFTKFAASLAGPYDALELPPESAEVDYEGELAVVIGRPGRRIARADALAHVAGYTVANDVSMRDYQRKTHQWLQGKCWEASTPLGPWLVTPDEAPDPSAMRLRTMLNGETLQDATTDTLIFDLPELIATLSETVTLEPGDVILTGTPGGVGMARDPKRFLAPGDTITVEVDGVGRIESAVVAGRSGLAA
jgi:acylpyruvate hydrolase